MYHLIKLEIRKNNLRPYLRACIFSFIVILGFTYFISAVAKVEQEQAFQSYENIFLFTSYMAVLYFSVLTTVMFSKIVIEAYKDRKLMLLFSYPISRTKVLLSKIFLVVFVSFTAMSSSYLLTLAVFILTESIYPIVPDQITFNIVSLTALRILLLAVTVSALSIIALGIGFMKKSVQAAIVSSLILVGIFGNIASGFSNVWIGLIIQVIIILVSFIVLKRLIHRVNHLDVT